MATIRLVPSNYARSNTSYVTVTNPTYAYDNTSDTSDYAQFRGRNSTSYTYYAFLNGFNFEDVPSGATVTDFRVLVRCYRNSYQSTGSSYRMRLASSASNNNVISNTTTSTDIGTSASVIEIPTGNLTWNQIVNYGSNFSIELVLRASSRQYPYIYVYGAEIEVTYTVSNPRTITSTLSGNGTINPSGAQTYYDGDEYELTITPTNKSDSVTVTNNGVDVTSQLVPHYTGGTSTSYSTASGTGVTTGFARSGSAFYQSSSTQSDSWLRYAIGHTAESPYSTSNTSNTYVKDGTNDATTQGWMNYPFDFSNLPLDANVTAVEVKCYGAIESTSQTASHADISLWCGNTQKGTTQQFTSTSNSTITIGDPGDWTREELQDAWVRFGVGYYGGRILGITWKVTYTTGGTLSYYTYSYEVDGNATIAVTIGNATPPSGNYTYTLTNSLVPGKKYLIANGNSGSVYLLTNESGGSRQLKGLAATVSGNKITLTAADNAKAEFECVRYTSGNDVTITVKSDNKYLYSDSSTGLRLNTPTTLDRFWHYQNGKFWQFKSTTTNGYTDTSSEYKYYLELNSSNNFTDNHLTSPSVQDTTLPNIYIYVEDDGSTPSTSKIYRKINGSWVQGSKVYLKINGSWVEQDSSTWSTLFNTSTNYRLMT